MMLFLACAALMIVAALAFVLLPLLRGPALPKPPARKGCATC